MVSEAHCKPTELFDLVILGIIFAALGWWMVSRSRALVDPAARACHSNHIALTRQ